MSKRTQHIPEENDIGKSTLKDIQQAFSRIEKKFFRHPGKNNSNYNFRFFNVFFSFCFTMSITSVFRKDLYTLLSPALPPVKSLDIVLWRLPGRSGWQSHQGNHYLFRICNQHGVPWNLKNFEKKKKHNETAYEQINTIISYNLRLTTVFNYMFLKSGSRNLQLSFEISISQHLL